MESCNVPPTAADVIAQYGPKVKGMKSSCGIIVGEISEHAAKRIVDRKITLSALLGVISNAPIIYPGNTAGRTCQQKDDLRLVLINETGEIRSVVRL